MNQKRGLILELQRDESRRGLAPERTSQVAEPLAQQPGCLFASSHVESDRGDQHRFGPGAELAQGDRTACGLFQESQANWLILLEGHCFRFGQRAFSSPSSD